MHKLRALALRLRGLLRSGSSDAEFAAELESHISLHTDDGIRNGLSPQEARRYALIRLGGAGQTHQAMRERHTLQWLEGLIQDTHYGLRNLRRSPGFTVTAVLTLALGIGACTAIFSLVNAVLIRSLPYGDASRLVYLFTPSSRLKIPNEVICPAYGNLYDIRRESNSFAGVTAYEQARFSLDAQGSAQSIGGARVDEYFFSTLQSAPELGRAIGPEDNQLGHPRVAVISHSLWMSMFGGNADVLKHAVQLNGINYQIVGVMPPEFEYPFKTDLPYGDTHIQSTKIWVPLALTPKQKETRDIGDNVAVARLRPGVSITQAQAEMSTMMARFDRLYPSEMGDWGALLESFTALSVGPVRPMMELLIATVVLVLLIACGNTANLLLARATGRNRELGVRSALGAGRGRLIRQMLTESLLIACAGGVVGVVLTFLFLQLLPHLDPGNIPRLNESTLDVRVLLVALTVSVLTSALSGVFPAVVVSRMDLTDSLRTHEVTGKGATHSSLQGILIVAQTAMVVVLLAGAGLLIRSYINVVTVDTGFSQSTLSMNVSLGDRYLQPQADRAAHFKQLMRQIRAIAGINSAGAVSNLPLSNTESLSTIYIDGFANQDYQTTEARTVTPQYFAAMNTPFIAGRDFTDEEASSAARPAIVNQKFVKTYYVNRNPVGGRVTGDNKHPDWHTIVGVVADVRHTGLEEDPQPQLYFPSYDFGEAFIAVRSSIPPATVANEIRRTLKSTDSNLAITDVHTMGDLVSTASARRRFQVSLLTAFAAIALLLALVGLYGLMAYSVSRRTREVGIRMALGAQRSDVLLLVLKKAALLLGLGVVSGLIASWFATRILKTFLFGVGEHDPMTIFSVCTLLAICGLIAALMPARRAASVDPMQALRSE
jgi:putative ABC transport system permease protein